MIRFLLLLLFLCPLKAEIESAYFAGGCFWCVEADFDKVEGVTATTSGYTGGSEVNPSYEQVSAGETGHVETVKIDYDNAVITYSELLDHYWKSIDPTRDDGQFCDKGSQYRPVIFYNSIEQKNEALGSKEKILKGEGLAKLVTKPSQGSPPPILVEIAPLTTFYPAEEYHQNYYRKNPYRYKYYRWNCGRDQRLKEIWE